MNSIAILSGMMAAAGIFRAGTVVDFLIAAGILTFGQIVASQLLLGIFGLLYLKNVILLNLALLLIIWLFARKQATVLAFNQNKEFFSDLFNNKPALFCITVVLMFGFVKLCINLVNPPFGWDSINYHFTFAVEWLKHGNLAMPITVSDDPSPPYYPIHGSIFYLWLIFPFRSVFLADLGQAPFYILAFLAVFSIARKWGLEKEPSFYAGLLLLITPNFFKQLQLAYVDVMVGALFLVCVHYVCLLSAECNLRNTLLYSIGLGLFLGLKTVALPYGVLLLVPFLYLCVKNLKKAYLLPLALLTVLLVGGFSYWRNFIETGNPLYPLDFNLFGRNIFKGVMESDVYSAHFTVKDYRLYKLLFKEGLGIQFLIFILPSAFLALPLTLLKRKKINFITGYFLIVPVLIYLIYRYLIPLANTRYLYALLGMGLLTGFYTARILQIPGVIIRGLVVICVLASVPALAKRLELVSSILLSVVTYFLLIRYKDAGRRILSGKKHVFVVCSVVCAVTALIVCEKYYQKNEFQRYKKMVKYSGFWPEATSAWEWLNSHTTGNTIAYIGRPVPFPLYGEHFKNNVYYVSVNKTEPARLQYFPHSRYRWGNDFLGQHRNFEEEGN
jgi:hypothetical protein